MRLFCDNLGKTNIKETTLRITPTFFKNYVSATLWCIISKNATHYTHRFFKFCNAKIPLIDPWNILLCVHNLQMALRLYLHDICDMIHLEAMWLYHIKDTMVL